MSKILTDDILKIQPFKSNRVENEREREMFQKDLIFDS